MRSALRLVLLLALLAAPARAQIDAGGAAPPNPSTLVTPSAPAVTIAAGAHAVVRVHLSIRPTWHINANPPSPDYMIPTLVTLRGGYGLTAGKAVYPEPRRLKVAFDDQPLAVYTDSAEVTLPLDAAAAAERSEVASA